MIKSGWRKVTKGLYGGSATAVSITSNGSYLLEADGNGIYRKQQRNEWTLVKKTHSRIRSFYSCPHSKLVLACGDKGSVMVSFDDGVTWKRKSEGIPPTELWNILAINDKEWLTHSYHHLYYTSDQGEHWKKITPFCDLNEVGQRRPEIRTISVSTDGIWLVGTKIHPTLGGVWAYINGSWVQIKQERFVMISSIAFYQDHLLIATGAFRTSQHLYGQVKALDVSHRSILESKEEDWFEIHNDQPQTGYLDLQASSSAVYVAAYGNGSEKSRGGAFKILWDTKRMVPIGEKRGQVWRIAGNDQEWLTAGVRTVEYSGDNQEWFGGFQNLEIFDIIVFNGTLWISTTNRGVVCTENGETWYSQNQGIPEECQTFEFKTIRGKLFLETDKGLFYWKKEQWHYFSTWGPMSKITEFHEAIYVATNKGLWQLHDGQLKMRIKGSIFAVAADSKEVIISTGDHILKYSAIGNWQQVEFPQKIVKFFSFNQQWMGLTDKGKCFKETDHGWVPCFSYGLKIFHIVPLQHEQLVLCTNKGLFLASMYDTSRVLSLFVGRNIRNAVWFQDKVYIGSLTNGLWVIDNMSELWTR